MARVNGRHFDTGTFSKASEMKNGEKWQFQAKHSCNNFFNKDIMITAIQCA